MRQVAARCPSEAGAHGEHVVAARFELVIDPQQKAQQGVLDQGAAQGGFDAQLTAIKCPAKLPLKAGGTHLPLEHAVAEALA